MTSAHAMREILYIIKWCINICAYQVRGASMYGYEEKEPPGLCTCTSYPTLADNRVVVVVVGVLCGMRFAVR